MGEKMGVKLSAGKGILLVSLVFFVVCGLLAEQTKLVVNVAKANVYLSPDSGSKVIDILTMGDVLSVFKSGQKTNEWFYVSYFSRTREAQATGFIHGSQITVVVDNEERHQNLPGQDDKEKSILASPDSGSEVELERKAQSDAGVVRNHSVRIGALYIIPSRPSFKDIYGSGMGFGGELNFGLWKSVGVWITGNYYTDNGSLSVTKETTTLSLFALGGGLKFRLSQARICPYLGIGPVIYFYKEDNPIGLAQGTGLGLIGQFELSIRIAGGLTLDACMNYTYCQVQPQNIKANVGGLQLGLSIGYSF